MRFKKFGSVVNIIHLPYPNMIFCVQMVCCHVSCSIFVANNSRGALAEVDYIYSRCCEDHMWVHTK